MRYLSNCILFITIISILRGKSIPQFYCNEETLGDIFSNTAQNYPSHVALIFENEYINYQQINKMAIDAAKKLLIHIPLLITTQCVIAIYLPRGIQLHLLQLSIIKTGSTLLSFDIDTPIDRINLCLKDAVASAIISMSDALFFCPSINPNQLITGSIHHAKHNLSQSPEQRELFLEKTVHSNCIAYIIYTSGSTGILIILKISN